MEAAKVRTESSLDCHSRDRVHRARRGILKVARTILRADWDQRQTGQEMTGAESRSLSVGARVSCSRTSPVAESFQRAASNVCVKGRKQCLCKGRIVVVSTTVPTAIAQNRMQRWPSSPVSFCLGAVECRPPIVTARSICWGQSRNHPNMSSTL
jgi:hypothetical protein